MNSSTPQPLVAVIMGSKSDWETMKNASDTLARFGVPHESRVLSAHRTPQAATEFASGASGRGLQVIIAAAGGAAHLAVLEEFSAVQVRMVAAQVDEPRGELQQLYWGGRLAETDRFPQAVPMPEWASFDTPYTNTAQEYVESIKRVVDRSGIDHAGIGTDTDLEPNVQRDYTNAVWKGETRGFFPAVAEEMLRAGFTPEEVTKIGGGNFCRIFGKITAAGARSSLPSAGRGQISNG